MKKVLVGIGIIAAIVVAGVLIGWLGVSTSKPRAGSEPVATDTTPPPAPRPVAATQLQSNPAPVPPVPSPKPVVTAAAAPATTDLVTNWEEKVDDILGADTDDTNKVSQLFDLYPRVPDDAKSEIAQHLSNLVSDTNYAQLGDLLKDPKQPDDALDVLMADALNRPNSLKLPVLLDVALTPDHPKAAEAKDILTLFLDEDFGTDRNAWQQKMQAWLKDNPD
jgi:hypothetical protein